MLSPALSMRTWEAPAVPAPKPKPVAKTEKSSRGYAGAHASKYVQFQMTLEAAHKAIQKDLLALRAHSRDLCQSNAFARRYINLVANHVVGPEGITLESEILGNKDVPKSSWNEEIERQWEAWGACVTADGELGWVEFQQLVAQTTAMDGECLIHKVRGYPNAWGLALEIIDADRLDWTFNLPADPKTGARTIMGIQMDRWGRRTGYWIWSQHPWDYEGAPRRELIPASEVWHIYAQDRARSVRGIPWMTAVMVKINMVGRLWNSELEAACYDSEHVMLIKGPTPPVDENGELIDSVNVADPVSTANAIQSEFDSNLVVVGMDNGCEAQFPPLNHPNPNLPEFAKNLLKGVASGLGVAYHSLTGDVADANYTASRVSLLDERDNWKKLQGWFIRQVCGPIFREWLESSVVSGAVRFPVLDWTKLYSPKWWPRSWQWVKPEEEIKAAMLAIRSGLSTHQAELGSLGKNWRKVFKQLKTEQAYQEELGVRVELDTGKGSSAAPSDLGIPDGATPTSNPKNADPKGGDNADRPE